jgi:hypothetical protein
MVKLVLVLLVVIGFLTAYAPTRSRIGAAAAPALAKLGPAGDFLTRPVHRWTAKSETDFIIDQIALAKTMGRDTPTEAKLQEWLKQRRVRTRYNGKDPWGSEYYLKRDKTSFTIGSCGPDGERNTPDDIRSTGSF